MSKKIYIMLSRSTTLASRFIYLLTKKKYTHSSISVHDDLIEMYSFCRIYPRLALPAGYSKESIYKGFYKIHSQIPCCLYELEVTDNQYDMVKEALNRLYEKRHLFSYDLMGTLDFISKKERRSFNKRYCSWFIAELLGILEIVNFDKPYSLIEPIDFASVPGINQVYEGNIEGLRNHLKECYNVQGKEG